MGYGGGKPSIDALEIERVLFGMKTGLNGRFKRLANAIYHIDDYSYLTKHQREIMRTKLYEQRTTLLHNLEGAINLAESGIKEVIKEDKDLSKCGELLRLIFESEKLAVHAVEITAIEGGIPLALRDFDKLDYAAGTSKDRIVLIAYKFIEDIRRQYDEFANVIKQRAKGKVRHVKNDEVYDANYTPSGLTKLEVEAIETDLESRRRMLDEQLFNSPVGTFSSYEGLHSHFKKKAYEVFEDLQKVIYSMNSVRTCRPSSCIPDLCYLFLAYFTFCYM